MTTHLNEMIILNAPQGAFFFDHTKSVPMKHLLFFSFLFILVSCQSDGDSQSKTQQAEEPAAEPAQVQLLLPMDFLTKAQGMPGSVFLDVRTPEEHQSGSISGSQNIDYRSESFKDGLKEIDKSTPVFVFCQGGSRSAAAAHLMVNMGYKQVFDMDGGYERLMEDISQ